jgi:hypothetical protein
MVIPCLYTIVQLKHLQLVILYVAIHWPVSIVKDGGARVEIGVAGVASSIDRARQIEREGFSRS